MEEVKQDGAGLMAAAAANEVNDNNSDGSFRPRNANLIQTGDAQQADANAANNANADEEQKLDAILEEGSGDGADVDSLLNTPLSNEDYPMSDIEEDKNYIEEIKEKGIEYETDGS